MEKKETCFASSRRDQHGRRRLDHHAEFEARERHAACRQLGGAFLDQLLRPLDLGDFRNHRQHDLDVAMNGSAQQRPQLCLEDIGTVEAHADAAPSEERVFLLGKLDAGDRLVAADIQRSDDHGIGRKGLGQRGVGLRLQILRRQMRMPHEEKLGAEQADSHRPGFLRRLDLFERAEIGRDLDHGSVGAPWNRVPEGSKGRAFPSRPRW